MLKTRHCSIFYLSVISLSLLSNVATLKAQDETKSEKTKEVAINQSVSEDPRSIDPATLIHPSLAKKATVNFDEVAIEEIILWLEEKTGMPVVMDKHELENEGLSIYDEHTDRLQDDPIYFLLNRLDRKQLGWYVKEEILHLTTDLALSNFLETKTYTVGDLLDAGYEESSLIDVIYSATAGPWKDIDQAGGDAKLLGDVLFINQTSQQHMRIRGLLAALRKHGQETYSFEAAQNHAIRARLQEAGTIDFQKEPLFRVVEKLSEQTGLDIRLDEQVLRNDGITPRDTVTRTIKKRKLKTILDLLFGELNLTTIIQDGIVLVTTEGAAAGKLKTVVYDISDLCKNENENMGLMDAILRQTSGPWQQVDQDGGEIVFPRYDTMVIRQTAEILAEVRALLESYREAIKVSKPRAKKDDSNEIITHYYKLDSAIAKELWDNLWILIPDGNVEGIDEKNPNLGRVLVFASKSTLRQGVVGNSKTGHSTADIALIPQSTMIVTHYKRIHVQIEELIRRIENGDPSLSSSEEGASEYGGGQQGGFGGGMPSGGGGGFFSVPVK